jgi:hypothetical protein
MRENLMRGTYHKMLENMIKLNPDLKGALKTNYKYEEKETEMIEKSTWKEFCETGLLWWINFQLHLFGWALVAVCEEGDKDLETVKGVYPARVKFRGFGDAVNDVNYTKLTKHIAENIETLKKDAGVN